MKLITTHLLRTGATHVPTLRRTVIFNNVTTHKNWHVVRVVLLGVACGLTRRMGGATQSPRS